MSYGQMVHTEDYKGGTIKLWAETPDESPEHVYQSGDPDYDAMDIAAAYRASGWFQATVTYKINGIELGRAFLGASSYASFDQFISETGGYYDDMKDEAYDQALEAVKPLLAWYGQQLTGVQA